LDFKQVVAYFGKTDIRADSRLEASDWLTRLFQSQVCFAGQELLIVFGLISSKCLDAQKEEEMNCESTQFLHISPFYRLCTKLRNYLKSRLNLLHQVFTHKSGRRG
jgi:hypothetical protein